MACSEPMRHSAINGGEPERHIEILTLELSTHLVYLRFGGSGDLRHYKRYESTSTSVKSINLLIFANVTIITLRSGLMLR